MENSMLHDIEKDILRLIDARRVKIIEFLKSLISYPSVTGHELEIQEYIAATLRSLGLHVDVWEPDLEALKKHPAFVPGGTGYANRPNVVAIDKGTGAGKSLLLNGHCDVIPPGNPDTWSHPPWAAEIEGGRLYGRGASDMKSGLAAMIMAVDAIKSSNLKLRGDLIIESTVDEELSGNGTLACVIKGYRADAGICCESSSLHVQPACIGRIWFEISITGKPAGIQRRWEGINAIDKGYAIAKAVSALEEIRINATQHALYPDNREALPCMVCMFQAGSFPSAFPDSCLLKGSMATLPGEDTDRAKQEFTKHIEKFAHSDPWLKDNPPQVRFAGYCGDPAEIPASHPIVSVLLQKYSLVQQKPPTVSGRLGAADIRYLIKYGKTPTVIFGPGLTEQMHATNEWVNIEDLMTGTKVLALAILEWCGFDRVN